MSDKFELPSDKTLKKWSKKYELYKEAHNGLAQYLSYEAEVAHNQLARIKKAFDWCKDNTAECKGTKYEDDSIVDNFDHLNGVLKEIFNENYKEE